MSNPTAIGLFSGAGGLDLGLEAAGFEITAAVELDQIRCETLTRNRPRWNVTKADTKKLSARELRAASECEHIDLVAAGPPCQPFSKSAYWQTEGKVTDTARSQTIFERVRIAREIGVRQVIIENVPGLCIDMQDLSLMRRLRACRRPIIVCLGCRRRSGLWRCLSIVSDCSFWE